MSALLDTRRPRLLLTLFCLLLWVPGFFTIPAGDRDESRFTQATKQMLETGDFVRIQNGLEARNRKPIGIYWLQAPFAAAARGLGLAAENPVWPYRIPSALGGWAAVLATFGLGERLVGRRAAVLAAGMLAASVLLVVETHIAKTDAALLGATTVAMAALSQAYLDPSRMRRGHAALFWAAMGVGILLKGPITPMVAGLAALTLALSDGRARWLRALRALRPAWGVPLMLALALPWFVAIGVATGGSFFTDAVGGDLGRKLSGGDNAHGAPPGMHVLLLPLLLFPATPALPGALLAAWRNRTAPATRLLLAWIVPAWLVFEAVPTKLPHYTLPLYPAVCLLVARWALSGAPQPVWSALLAAVLTALGAAALGVGGLALPYALHETLWLGVPALAAAGCIAAMQFRAPPGRAVLAGLVLAPLIYWALLALELPQLSALWIAPRVEAAVPANRLPLGAVGYSEPSLMFLMGTDTAFFGTAAAAARALQSGEVRSLLVDEHELPALREALTRIGLHVHRLAAIEGLNYSRGRWQDLWLFVPDT